MRNVIEMRELPTLLFCDLGPEYCFCLKIDAWLRQVGFLLNYESIKIPKKKLTSWIAWLFPDINITEFGITYTTPNPLM